tara:strand:+ start:138 stop:332 length:195 start_codon:yes stop_codon:yes gene_type:complete
MIFKEVTQGYTFLQNEDEPIKVFNTIGDIEGLDPIFISQESVETQKDFEIEISYILMDHLDSNK